jgi:hypothetical protein
LTGLSAFMNSSHKWSYFIYYSILSYDIYIYD